MPTIDRRGFLATAAAASAAAALGRGPPTPPRPARARRARRLDAAREAAVAGALPRRPGGGFDGVELAHRHRPEGRRRDQGGGREHRPRRALDHELRPLEVPAVERRPGRRREERRRDGDVAAQRLVLRRRLGAARPRGREPGDRLPGRLDAVAEGRSASGSCRSRRAEGGRRHRGGLEQVPLSARSSWRATWTSSSRRTSRRTSTSATCSSTATRRTGCVPLGERIWRVHLKDFKLDRSGGRFDWKNLGEGDIDWPAVRKAFADVGYTGWVDLRGRGRRRRVPQGPRVPRRPLPRRTEAGRLSPPS